MPKSTLKRLSLRAVLLLSLLLAGMITAYASEITYIGKNPDGSTVWVSFGSSAGYSVWRCPADGGPCTDVTPQQ